MQPISQYVQWTGCFHQIFSPVRLNLGFPDPLYPPRFSTSSHYILDLPRVIVFWPTVSSHLTPLHVASFLERPRAKFSHRCSHMKSRVLCRQPRKAQIGELSSLFRREWLQAFCYLVPPSEIPRFFFPLKGQATASLANVKGRSTEAAKTQIRGSWTSWERIFNRLHQLSDSCVSYSLL